MRRGKAGLALQPPLSYSLGGSNFRVSDLLRLGLPLPTSPPAACLARASKKKQGRSGQTSRNHVPWRGLIISSHWMRRSARLISRPSTLFLHG